jgi:hypothetical protein
MKTVLECANCDNLIEKILEDGDTMWNCKINGIPTLVFSRYYEQIHIGGCSVHSALKNNIKGEQKMRAQLCPKCQGQGVVGVPPGVPGNKDEYGNITFVASQTSWTCDLCNGKMYILVP